MKSKYLDKLPEGRGHRSRLVRSGSAIDAVGLWGRQIEKLKPFNPPAT